jgi:hypothetical protein
MAFVIFLLILVILANTKVTLRSDTVATNWTPFRRSRELPRKPCSQEWLDADEDVYWGLDGEWHRL